jgi:hypothetical protein
MESYSHGCKLEPQGFREEPILEFSALHVNETVIFGDDSRSVPWILTDRSAIVDET